MSASKLNPLQPRAPLPSQVGAFEGVELPPPFQHRAAHPDGSLVVVLRETARGELAVNVVRTPARLKYASAPGFDSRVDGGETRFAASAAVRTRAASLPTHSVRSATVKETA